MAQKLKKIFEAAMAEGGMKAKMRLTVSSGIPEAKCLDLPDSPENIAKLSKAFKEITGKASPVS